MDGKSVSVTHAALHCSSRVWIPDKDMFDCGGGTMALAYALICQLLKPLM